MRTSTLIVLGIMVAAFGLLMWLANSSLGLWRPDVEAAQELTRRFRERGDVEGERPVRLRRMDGSQDRKGPGLNVEVAPAAAVLGRDGGLEVLVRALALEALSAYPPDAAESLRWFKVTVHLPGGIDRIVHVDRPPDGTLQRPIPALPRTWPERASPPAPPAPPVPPGALPGPEEPAGPR